jgi:hypothetical protein
MQPEQEQIRFGDGSFAPEDDSLLRQPTDDGVDDPDTELPDRPSDQAEDPDDEVDTER